jgi:hypothetical protein
MVLHKHSGKFPVRTAAAYIIIIVFAYIYTHHIVDKHGDIITDAPSFDILGNYKCAVDFPGCESQYIDGWGISRVFAYMFIGIINPHSHTNMFTTAVLVQAYSYAHNNKGRHLLNPLLMITGYSIGSAMCPGSCQP